MASQLRNLSKRLFLFIDFSKEVQKKPLEVFYEEICSQKFGNIYRNASVLESLYNKVAGIQDCNFVKRDFYTDVFL